MAEQTITVVKFGAALVWQDAHADGHAYANDGNTLVYVNNVSGSTATLSHTEQSECDFGHANVNGTDDSPSGGVTRIWRGKSVLRWNDATGRAHVTFTTALPGSSTDLQVAAVSYQDT